MVAHVWNEQATLGNPASYIPFTKLPAITTAALAACDAQDGIVDGIINDPQQCHFDPSSLMCSGAESAKAALRGRSLPRSGRSIRALAIRGRESEYFPAICLAPNRSTSGEVVGRFGLPGRRPATPSNSAKAIRSSPT